MPSPRRITVLIDSLIGGGAERIAVEAAIALDPERYVGHLLVTRGSGSLEARVREAGLEHTILGRQRGFHPRLFAGARRIVASGDLLHAHKFAGSAWGALLARAAARPLVAHEHTFDGATSLQRTVVYRGVIAPTAARILCVSEGVAASLRAEGIAASKLEVVVNGVLMDDSTDRAAARRELGLEQGATVIGMVARLRPEKRHALALETLAALRARDERPVLCIVGDGPLEGELRERARTLGVEDAVVWAGERPNAQRLMRAFDAVLLCSSYEGMPLAVLEALVSGVPVVSTAVGSLPELLADGGGVLARGDDPLSLVEALEACLHGAGDEDGRARVQERFRERFGIGRLARDLERIYDQVLAR